jgi:hypothetical protein
MILTGENRSIRRKSCSSATLYTARTDFGMKFVLLVDKSNPRCIISRKFFQWEPSYLKWTDRDTDTQGDRQTDSPVEGNSHFHNF